MNILTNIDGKMGDDLGLYRNNFIKSLELLDVDTTNVLLENLGSDIEIKEFVDKSLFKDSQEYCGNLALSKDNRFINIIYVQDEPSEEEIKSYVDFQMIISNSLERDKLNEGKNISNFETVIISYDLIEESIRNVNLYGRNFAIEQYSFLEKIKGGTYNFIFNKLVEKFSSLGEEEVAKHFLKKLIGDGDIAGELLEHLMNNPPEMGENLDLNRTVEFDSKKGGSFKFSIRKATEEDLRKHNINPNDLKKVPGGYSMK